MAWRLHHVLKFIFLLTKMLPLAHVLPFTFRWYLVCKILHSQEVYISLRKVHILGNLRFSSLHLRMFWGKIVLKIFSWMFFKLLNQIWEYYIFLKILKNVINILHTKHLISELCEIHTLVQVLHLCCMYVTSIACVFSVIGYWFVCFVRFLLQVVLILQLLNAQFD